MEPYRADAESPATGPPGPRGPANIQIALGLFILLQIVFLLGANSLMMMKELHENIAPGETADVVAQLTTDFWTDDGMFHDVQNILKHWGEVTGQDQHWSLFAPNVGENSTFIEVELRWDDPRQDNAGKAPYPPERLLSGNIPDDVESYVRWGYFRLRKYESHLDVTMRVWTEAGETPERARQRWRRAIERKVRNAWDDLLSYMRWRWLHFKSDHPERPPPRQVILLVRRYGIPHPDVEPWQWEGPDTSPVARWQPGRPLGSRYLTIEMYNPVTRAFERLER